MKKWQQFEVDCVQYLKESYGNYFTHHGSSDSTVSDIKYEGNGKSFYIEAKMSDAQSGQFVVLPDLINRKFIFSTQNKSQPNETTNFLINLMNKDFDKYVNPGTRGKIIDINQEIFSDWIVHSYELKDVKFIITKSSENYIIIPIHKFDEYFKVSAKYRIKKSGSNNVPKKYKQEVLDELNSNNISFKLLNGFMIKSFDDLNNLTLKIFENDYYIKKIDENIYKIQKNISDRITNKNKKDVKNELRSRNFSLTSLDSINIKTTDNLDDYRFTVNSIDYRISKVNQNIYNIKKLSATNNPSLIFSIKLKKEQDKQDLEYFIKSL